MRLVSSPSSILANMAAGFLGGRGPAAELGRRIRRLSLNAAGSRSRGRYSAFFEAGHDCGPRYARLSKFTPSPRSPTQASLCLRLLAASGMQLPSGVQDAAGSDVHGDEFVKSLEPALGAHRLRP
jgi:hypothetical protein